MSSVWIKNSDFKKFPSLDKNIKTDVLIIGGGITGILCGYMLKKAGVQCVIAESDRILSGVTGNTTAKITVLHGFIYDRMIKRFGKEVSRLYLKANMEALEEYRKISKDIDCDFEDSDAYVYSSDDKEKAEKEVRTLNSLGFPAKFDKAERLPFKVAGAVKAENQAQFNPLEFLSCLSEDLEIYENTRVMELTPDGAVCNGSRIKANKIIAATHFPFINKHGSYFLKMYQHRSYVIALENAPDLGGMYVDGCKTGMSFRNYRDLLLVGGAGQRTGKKCGGWEELSAFIRQNYPEAHEVARWATQDCMTLDGIPYIGQYSKRTPNFYVATGFNKWGMTSAMVSARLLTDIICEKKNDYVSVFSPSRSIIRPQLASNAAHAIINLLTPTVPRCPHVGCALKYNKHEHSWDCPCHGSRFDEDGKLLDNPSTQDKKLRR